MEEYKGAIGIDLGTCYSCVGVWNGDRFEVITNDQGNRITPSYVSFTDEERLIGDTAKSMATLNPRNTIFDAKRLIGRKFDDPTVQSDMKHWPFDVVKGENNRPMFQVTYKNELKTFYPEEISAMILGEMKRIAENYLGKRVKNAVITVPAYFDNAQRQATKDAGTIAGLNVLRIINEPTASSIAYGLNKTDKNRTILVFDLGGGTFDISILTIEDGIFEVIGTGGNTHLGGEDFDNRLVEYFQQELKNKHKMDISKNPKAIRRLRSACENAKRKLSVATQAEVSIDALYEGQDFHSSIRKAKFEQLNMDLFNETIKCVKNTLEACKMDKYKIDEIVLVGGSSRIPKIQEMLSNFFNGKKLNHSVSVDEAVAFGAAVQGAVLSGQENKAIIIDVAPLSLGIETAGGIMSKLIERNTYIPCKKSQTFSTNADYQTSASIKVLEGERALSKDNMVLGNFELTGISKKKRGEPQIEVTFEIDANGILNVSATEGNNSKKITITNDASRFNEEDITEMLKKAQEMKAHDEAIVQRVQAKNTLETYLYRMKHSMEEGTGGEKGSTCSIAVDEAIRWMDENQNATKEEYEKKLKEIQYIFASFENEGNRSMKFEDLDID